MFYIHFNFDFYCNSPSIQSKGSHKAKLARRITGEYHAARGSSHLEMLRNARDALASKRDQAQAECKQLDTELQENQSREQMAYEQALVHDLVMHHLTIPGIGPSLARQLQTSVFHGNLTDLYRAESIHGVGATAKSDQAVDRYTTTPASYINRR